MVAVMLAMAMTMKTMNAGADDDDGDDDGVADDGYDKDDDEVGQQSNHSINVRKDGNEHDTAHGDDHVSTHY